MSCRWKLTQMGAGNWPLINLPLHKSQLGDPLLLPSSLVSGFKGILTGVAPCPIVVRDPTLTDLGGIGHLHKNWYLRFCREILQISTHYETWKKVSLLLFGKEMSLEQFNDKPPQFTGTECSQISLNFENILLVIGGTVEVRNCLRVVKHWLDKVAFSLFESNDTTSISYWWEVRCCFILFVGVFGEDISVPSIAELVYVIPFFVQKIEHLSTDSGLPLRIKHFCEWVMEQRNGYTNQLLKKTNNFTESDSKIVSQNAPEDRSNKITQVVWFGLLV